MGNTKTNGTGVIYNELMDEIGISRVVQRPDRSSVFAQYTVMLNQRDIVREKLSALGIPTSVHYPVPLNEQPAYRRHCCPECTPIASATAKKVMSLPMSPDLTNCNMNTIIQPSKRACVD